MLTFSLKMFIANKHSRKSDLLTFASQMILFHTGHKTWHLFNVVLCWVQSSSAGNTEDNGSCKYSVPLKILLL